MDIPINSIYKTAHIGVITEIHTDVFPLHCFNQAQKRIMVKEFLFWIAHKFVHIYSSVGFTIMSLSSGLDLSSSSAFVIFHSLSILSAQK